MSPKYPKNQALQLLSCNRLLSALSFLLFNVLFYYIFFALQFLGLLFNWLTKIQGFFHAILSLIVNAVMLSDVSTLSPDQPVCVYVRIQYLVENITNRLASLCRLCTACYEHLRWSAVLWPEQAPNQAGTHRSVRHWERIRGKNPSENNYSARGWQWDHSWRESLLSWTHWE